MPVKPRQLMPVGYKNLRPEFKHAAIVVDVLNGLPVKDAALKYEISIRYIYKIVKKHKENFRDEDGYIKELDGIASAGQHAINQAFIDLINLRNECQDILDRAALDKLVIDAALKVIEYNKLKPAILNQKRKSIELKRLYMEPDYTGEDDGRTDVLL